MPSSDDPAGTGTAPRPRGRSRLPAALGAALVLLGVGAWLVGAAAPRARERAVGGNLPVATGATDEQDMSANNSPSIARSPVDARRLAVVNRVDLPLFSCAVNVSADGGGTWTPSTIPFPEGEELPARCFAPDLAFGADGTLYVSFVTLIGEGNTPNAAWTVSSGDGGRTFSTPRKALGPLAFQVRIAADPTVAGRIHLSWLQAAEVALFQFPTTGNPVLSMRSDDGGTTWGPHVRVSPAERARVVAPSIVTGPDGLVLVLYLDLLDDRLDYAGAHAGRGGDPYPGRWSLVVGRSTDGGATFRSAEVDRDIVPWERFIVFFPPTPSIATDPSGRRVYVAFHDARLGDADVWLWASDDGGRTFGARRRVNDTARKDGTAQYLPRIAVAPDGRVDVVYYDRRADRKDLMNEVSLQSSGDLGRSFGPRVRLSDRSFSSRIGFGAFREMPDLGSRLAVTSTDRRALALWADTRAGTASLPKQVLARQVVAFAPGSAWRTPLRVGGGVLVLAGLVAFVAGLRPRRPDPTEDDEDDVPVEATGRRAPLEANAVADEG
ncbi:MAG TPA: sialidase family protein [Acidimicrobiales bacterium]|nr:sialidase family protein [Acidimicrobiales bacterium]